MEIIREIFSYISGLGNYVMIPIMITLVGLIVRLKPVNAIRAGMTVGIGLIGMNMILNLLWTYISPVASTLVDMSNINLTTMDIGWTAAAGLAFSTVIGSFIIPFILLVNILMLITRCTRTINIDIWNYWYYAFSGATVYILTNNYICAFVAAAAHCCISLLIADRTAKTMQEALGVPGISIPQGFAVTSVPIFLALDKFYDLIHLPKGNAGSDDSQMAEKFGWLKTLSEPMFLGAIIGIILGAIARNDVKTCLTCGMAMAALMYLLPRMVKVIMEGLLPISNQARDFMQKKFHGEEFYIGMDSAIMLGIPVTMQVALVLIPITLLLSAIVPYNQTLPVGDLASTAYFVAMATPIHKNSFLRTLISGTIMMGIVLLLATYFAPMITSFAMTGALEIPEGAVQVTALSAGAWFSWVFCLLAKFRLLGSAIIVAVVGALIAACKKIAK